VIAAQISGAQGKDNASGDTSDVYNLVFGIILPEDEAEDDCLHARGSSLPLRHFSKMRGLHFRLKKNEGGVPIFARKKNGVWGQSLKHFGNDSTRGYKLQKMRVPFL
jgi:hypothetical protein